MRITIESDLNQIRNSGDLKEIILFEMLQNYKYKLKEYIYLVEIHLFNCLLVFYLLNNGLSYLCFANIT